MTPRRALPIALLALALALSACGRGGGSGSASETQPLSVRGAVVKGPVQNAQVQLFALDDGGFATGEPLQTLTTDAFGRFSFARPADGPALLAVTRGGSFLDEADPQPDPERRRRVTLTGEQGFESVLPAGATTLVVTPYTESLLLRARRAANGANFLALFDAVRARAVEAFGFDPFAVIPEAPLAPNPAASIESRRYALLLGGAAFAMQSQAAALGTFPTYFTIRAFIEDFSDGRLDGRLNGDPVPVLGNPQPLPSGVSLADAVLRFRNNNFAAYTGVDPSPIDESLLAAGLALPNQPPLARNDLFSTPEDVALVVDAPGVLSNDLDRENQALSAELLSGPANGTLVLAPGGGFTYTPNPDFNGTDSFTYRASDGIRESDIATVTLTVGGRNDPPMAAVDRYSTDEDTVLTVRAPGVLTNDTDGEGQDLTVLLVSPPASGTLSLNRNGRFTYTPNANFTGEDSFTYQASDGTAQSSVVTVTLSVNAANDAPLARDDLFSTAEDVALVVAAPGLLGNDSDAEDDSLTVELVGEPENGTLVLAPSGGFSYTPNPDFNGTDSFAYRASDGSADSNTATVTLTVGERNDSPLAAADSYSTLEDTALVVDAPGVLGNDSDPERMALTAALVAGPADGSLSLSASGGFTYTPNAGFSGSDAFTYQASDGTAQSGVVTVSLTVNPVNDPPLATDDSFSTREGTPLDVAAPGVLGNDSDPEGTDLTAVLVTPPVNGSLSLLPSGRFTYTPNAEFSGTDSFTYRASDGAAQSNVATVSLTVGAVNDPPLAAGNAFTTDEGRALTVPAPGVLGNDSDPEGAALTAVRVAGPANGTLILNPNGSFTYTPNADFNGADAFTYQASDGTAQSGVVTVNLTVTAVNDPPLAAGDSFSTNEGTPLTVPAPGVLGNDSDPDGSALTATLVAGPANGSLSLMANGRFTYTPNADFSGVDAFTYRASDGTAQSNLATVTLTVNGVNDAPLANADSFSTNEGTALTIPAPGVLGNDSDPEGTPLTAVLVAGPANGVLNLLANGRFTYTPNGDFSGADAFTYQASDGTALSAPATVSLTVNPVNDPPIAAGDSFSTDEGVPLTIPAPGVLANDTDPEGTALTAVLVAGPANGSLSLLPSGRFTYTPNANFNGTDTFTYRASDGAAQSNVATVSLTVNAVNDAPVAVGDRYSTNEDTALTVPAPGVLGNDSDPDGTALTAVLVAGPANGTLSLMPNGRFTYTPNDNFNGADAFTYQASDGTAQSGVVTVTLTVTAVNDPPLAAADNFSTNEGSVLTVAVPGVLGNDSDPDGTALTSVLVTGPADGSLNLSANGSFTYTPDENFSGADAFTYRASDGTAQSPLTTVSLIVNAVNDPPLAVGDSFSTDEGTPLTVTAPGVLGNDSDPEDAPLTAVLVAGPANGSLSLNPNGGFTYTPDDNFNGADAFTYRASDGTAQSNLATVSISVEAVNDPPLAVNDSYSTAEETVLDVSAPGVLANDTDPDENPLTTVLVTGPANGTLSLNADGSFIYTPNPNFDGTDTFTYRATDGTAQSNLATVSLTVGPENDPPLGVEDGFSTAEDTALNVPASGVLDNDSDPEGTALIATLVAGPANGSLTLNADGGFTYTPTENFNGADSFTYQASDGTAQSAVVTVSLTVTAVNDPPLAVDDSFSTAEEVVLNVAVPGVLANDTDPDADPLSAILVAGPANGSLNLFANGRFVYTPDLDFNGVDSFTYRASDGTAQSSVATVSLTVGAENDPPLAVADSFSTNEDTVLNVSAPGVLDNDSDPEGTAITAVQVAGPANGSLSLNADGSFTYTPDENFNGSDSFTYQASDGTAQSGVVTVSLTVNAVNDAPVAAGDSFSTAEETPLDVSAPGVLINDTDAEGTPLTAILVAGPANGSLSLNPNGSLTYTPDLNFNGADTFTYSASDGSEQSDVATVSITVGAVNDPPMAGDNSFSTNEDMALTVPAPGVLGNDSDPEGMALTAVLAAGPTKGTLNLLSNGGFTYTPNANVNGTDSFTYRASDGTLQSDLATVSLTVNGVNDVPVAANDSFSTAEETPLNVPATGVLANDSDADGNPLTAVLIAGPANGTLSLNANGGFMYTPNANFSGSDSFTYRAADSTTQSDIATVSLTVSSVNDPPLAVDDSFSTNEDTALNVPATGVLGNDSDPEGNTLTAVLVLGPDQGGVTLNPNGSFTYTPNPNFNGSTSFTYRAFDGTAQSNIATVTLTVTAVNDPPETLSDSFTFNEDTVLNVPASGLLANDSDPEGSPLTAVLVAGPLPSQGVLVLNSNGDGGFTFTPRANLNGMVTFIYQASDGTAQSANTLVILNVIAVNDPPLALSNSFSTNEDTALTVPAPGVLGNDSDPEGSALTAMLVSGPGSGQGAVVLNADGSFTYTPNLNFNGTTSFTYQAIDSAGAQSLPATVTLPVTAVNDAPVAVNDLHLKSEISTLEVFAPGVLANDTDVDSAALTAVLVTGPATGSVVLRPNGSFTFTPTPGNNNSTSFTYRANDGSLDSNVATVTINVIQVNDPPVANADFYATPAGVTLLVPAPGLLANDTDPDGDPLAALVETLLEPGGGPDGFGSLLFQDTFDGEPDPGMPGQSPAASLINWNITAGTVDLQPPVRFGISPNVGRLLDLDGTAPPVGAGTIQTKQNFNLPEGNYLLTFRASNNNEAPDNPNNSMTVSVAGQSRNFTTAMGAIFAGTLQEFSFQFGVPATTSTRIVFAHAGGDGAGILIDDVRLIRLNVLPADGSFVYVPLSCIPAGMFPSSFTYRATDGALQSAPATVTITVTSQGCN